MAPDGIITATDDQSAPNICIRVLNENVQFAFAFSWTFTGQNVCYIWIAQIGQYIAL